MEFRLFYRGLLGSNKNPKEKHRIRRYFHSQFKTLWEQEPLSGIRGTLLKPMPPPNDKLNVIRKVGGFTFAPLVCEDLHWTATLDITLLKTEPPGRVVTQCGDIDNRLKTLLDALRIPRNENEIPAADAPLDGENPFFCLLEDDHLVTSLSVTTDRLLVRVEKIGEVILIIKVNTTAHRSIWPCRAL